MQRNAWGAALLAAVASAGSACGNGESGGSGESGSTYAMLRDKVVINGVALGEEQLREFQQRYGQGPRPGRYWYDARSGLFGNEGGPSLGWILPGHAFGALAPDASRGSTGVFVNGRQLELNDAMALSSILGPILPGRYWLDGLGNYGYEGYDVPAGNLYLTMQAQAGSGGDNAWSTRFSAGNYTNDNSAGYVQCPDGTFVTYGM
jgi:hypothetical protein